MFKSKARAYPSGAPSKDSKLFTISNLRMELRKHLQLVCSFLSFFLTRESVLKKIIQTF
jgi:hypothetical protein